MATGGCDAAVIDVANADDLNPIDGDFAYGARVRLRPEEKVRSANILQKGVPLGGSEDANQWKLEMTEGGRPTCVLIVAGSSGRHPATSTIDIADGEWHTVDCTRMGTILTVHVDSVARGTRTIPADLTIDNAEPLRMGGSTPVSGTHPFAGAIDDVYFSRPG